MSFGFVVYGGVDDGGGGVFVVVMKIFFVAFLCA